MVHISPSVLLGFHLQLYLSINYYLITKGLFGENDNNYKRRETRNDGTLTARDGIDGTNGHYTVGMQDKIYKEF